MLVGTSAGGLALAGIVALGAGCGRLGFDEPGVGPGGTVDGGGGDGGSGGDGGDAAATGDALVAPLDGSAGCVLPAGRIVHLAFEEGSGLTTADASGGGNTAQLIGMNNADWVTGRLGGALDFDGVDDRVNAGSATALDNVIPVSMCAWIRPRSYPSNFPTIADKSIDSFTGGWFFYIENNAQFGFQGNRRKWITGGTIVLGAWTHVCVTWDGTDGFAGIRLFQDGASTAMKNSGSNGTQLDSDAVRDLLIGRVNNGSFPFDGVIDDFMVYPRVLTAQEIAVIHSCAGN